MTDKELNSHDLARELEIVKLQEENERLNGAIQTYDILLKSNVEENEELKSQLRGTTHCFDEEEHNRLKEEITNLSKDVDMWNAKYNDMFDENRMLKKQVAGKIEISENQQKKFIKYLEDKKDRLARECSQIYEDSLGHTRLVNADKFDEVNDILQKYKSIIGENNE